MTYHFVMAEGAAPDLEVENEFLQGQDTEVRIARLDNVEAVERETEDADGVIVALEPMPLAFIEKLGPGVKIIGRAGIGLDAIDLDAAGERGIAVFHTPDYATEEVATHAVALLLALNRRILEGNALAREDWDAYEKLTPVKPLSEQVVGVVGLGRIGQAVIDRLRPFGATILGFDPYLEQPPEGVALVETLHELLSESDAITLHLPLTDETRGLIGKEELDAVRPGGVLINVSRGGLIDGDAITDALARGVLRAGLDVWNVEPPPPDSKILGVRNVVLTPHFAWYSDASEPRMRRDVLAGMLAYLREQPLPVGRLAVDPR